jgi:hypothetical protein
MTDADDWQQLRTEAAAKNARRFHYNGHGYWIYMDRFGAEIFESNVHWIDVPPPGKWLEMPCTSAGSYLGEYHIDQDDKPDWHAVVTVGRPNTDDGDVRITSVVITGESLDTTALPLSEIKRALFKVGGVFGTWTTSRLEKSGHIMTNFHMAITADGQPIRPDELRGTNERAGMRHPDTFAKVLALIEEHKKRKLTNPTGMTQREYVAKGTGYSVTNIQKLITNAKKWAAENNQGTQ